MKKVAMMLSVLGLSIVSGCATHGPIPPDSPESYPGPAMVSVDDRGDAPVVEIVDQRQIVWEASAKVELHIEIENNPRNGKENTMRQPDCSANRCMVEVPQSGGCAIWKYTTRFGATLMMDPFIIKREQSGGG